VSFGHAVMVLLNSTPAASALSAKLSEDVGIPQPSMVTHHGQSAITPA
jgi:hypothetical protein